MASETLTILETGVYALGPDKRVDIGNSLRNCIAGTRQFSPEELFRMRDESLARATPHVVTDVSVVNETSLSGASHLCHAGPDGRVAVLNFASAKNPGGGFLGGSQAQEESLARSSGLYHSLLKCPEHYDYHRTSSSLLYSHRAIYSPGCPVFRSDPGDLLPEPYLVDFITCPAPNAGAVQRNQPAKTDEVVPVLRERVTLILGLALYFGLTDLVLGAWGCGVFRNDPISVAEAFRDALGHAGQFACRFRSVRFSVLDGSPEKLTYHAFADRFVREGQPMPRECLGFNTSPSAGHGRPQTE